MTVDLATTPRAFVTIKELAEYLSCDRRTILRLVTIGTLPSVRVGRSYRIRVDVASEMFHVARHQAAS